MESANDVDDVAADAVTLGTTSVVVVDPEVSGGDGGDDDDVLVVVVLVVAAFAIGSDVALTFVVATASFGVDASGFGADALAAKGAVDVAVPGAVVDTMLDTCCGRSSRRAYRAGYMPTSPLCSPRHQPSSKRFSVVIGSLAPNDSSSGLAERRHINANQRNSRNQTTKLCVPSCSEWKQRNVSHAGDGEQIKRGSCYENTY